MLARSDEGRATYSGTHALPPLSVSPDRTQYTVHVRQPSSHEHKRTTEAYCKWRCRARALAAPAVCTMASRAAAARGAGARCLQRSLGVTAASCLRGLSAPCGGRRLAGQRPLPRLTALQRTAARTRARSPFATTWTVFFAFFQRGCARCWVRTPSGASSLKLFLTSAAVLRFGEQTATARCSALRRQLQQSWKLLQALLAALEVTTALALKVSSATPVRQCRSVAGSAALQARHDAFLSIFISGLTTAPVFRDAAPHLCHP